MKENWDSQRFFECVKVGERNYKDSPVLGNTYHEDYTWGVCFNTVGEIYDNWRKESPYVFKLVCETSRLTMDEYYDNDKRSTNNSPVKGDLNRIYGDTFEITFEDCLPEHWYNVLELLPDNTFEGKLMVCREEDDSLVRTKWVDSFGGFIRLNGSPYQRAKFWKVVG